MLHVQSDHGVAIFEEGGDGGESLADAAAGARGGGEEVAEAGNEI